MVRPVRREYGDLISFFMSPVAPGCDHRFSTFPRDLLPNFPLIYASLFFFFFCNLWFMRFPIQLSCQVSPPYEPRVFVALAEDTFFLGFVVFSFYAFPFYLFRSSPLPGVFFFWLP